MLINANHGNCGEQKFLCRIRKVTYFHKYFPRYTFQIPYKQLLLKKNKQTDKQPCNIIALN